MLHDTPLRAQHQEYVTARSQRQTLRDATERPGAASGQVVAGNVEYMPYGPLGADGTPTCEIVAGFGAVELEYAVIRRGVGIFDSPHRGTLRVNGSIEERRNFLNRMLTQELKDLVPGMTKQALWLNRKGRVDADVLVIECGDAGMFIDVDIHQAAATARSLTEFIVMEDVQIDDVSSQFHHIAVHGIGAIEMIAAACGLATEMFSQQHSAISSAINTTPVVIARRDQTGEPGFELIMPFDSAAKVWNALFAVSESLIAPIGWLAFNIARIEAGTPLFNIDFGSTNLPHETGVLRDRVSFTKGCYLGQEIVARLENLGKPKQQLVGVRMLEDRLPTAGEQVFACNDDNSMGEEVGVITSSTMSPMLGNTPIAFGMIKTSHAANGVKLIVNAEGEQARAETCGLQFWKRAEQSA